MPPKATPNKGDGEGNTPKKTPNRVKVKENETCTECNQNVTNKDKAMLCDICEIWHHCKCANMTDLIYNFYKNNEKMSWVCNTCIKEKKETKKLEDLITGMVKRNEEEKITSKKERDEMMNEVKDLGKTMTKIQEEQNTKLRELSEQISKIEGKTDEKINERIKSSEKDILLKLNSEMDEKMEKFKRRSNIILYGVPECTDKEQDERIKSDIQKIERLFREIEVATMKINPIRLGKKVTAEKPRPIKIELDSEAEKFNILKKAGKIKTINIEELKHIIISSDMTLKQRELDKILREELKDRRLKGERNIKIKNGKIIALENVNDVASS